MTKTVKPFDLSYTKPLEFKLGLQNILFCNRKANKIHKMFYEAYMLFNFTFYKKNLGFYNEKKVGLFCPVTPGL
jgi:hypothetical protein